MHRVYSMSTDYLFYGNLQSHSLYSTFEAAWRALYARAVSVEISSGSSVSTFFSSPSKSQRCCALSSVRMLFWSLSSTARRFVIGFLRYDRSRLTTVKYLTYVCG